MRRQALVLMLLVGASRPALASPPLPPPPPAPDKGQEADRPAASEPAPAPPTVPRSGGQASTSLRTGLLLAAVAGQAIATTLDIATARRTADTCGRPEDRSGGPLRCRPGDAANLGLGVGALASYVTSFSLSAGFGYVQGRLQAQRGAAPAARQLRALAWSGGLLVAAGLVGVASSGLATQGACGEAGCDPRRLLSASLLRSASVLGVSLGAGMLTWREGARRVVVEPTLGPGRASLSLRLQF